MLIFIFGDNIVKSRNNLCEIISETSKDREIIRFGDNSNETDFRQAVESNSFFSEEKLIVFENFFKGKPEKWKSNIDFKKLEARDGIYIFWEEALNAFAKKVVLHAKKNNVFEFKLPNLIWFFLDNIRPNSATEQIKLFNDCLKTIDENYLFLMIVRQFRLLILIKNKFKDYPSDYKRLTFQKYKLAKQSGYFSLEALLAIYKKLLIIEENIKTGRGIYDLKIGIEKFLIDL